MPNRFPPLPRQRSGVERLLAAAVLWAAILAPDSAAGGVDAGPGEPPASAPPSPAASAPDEALTGEEAARFPPGSFRGLGPRLGAAMRRARTLAAQAGELDEANPTAGAARSPASPGGGLRALREPSGVIVLTNRRPSPQPPPDAAAAVIPRTRTLQQTTEVLTPPESPRTVTRASENEPRPPAQRPQDLGLDMALGGLVALGLSILALSAWQRYQRG